MYQIVDDVLENEGLDSEFMISLLSNFSTIACYNRFLFLNIFFN
jgi:hypothetical protein